MIKKITPAMKAMKNVLQEYGEIEDDGWYFKEGDRVTINFDKVTMRNRKRNEWIKDHMDEVFTIEYDQQYKNKPMIYCLKEDESDPKWLFAYMDLIPYEEKTEETEETEANKVKD